jgi:hypothetical protein
MKHKPRKPECLAERREMERAVVKEIEETAGQTANVCPECGSADYHYLEGCMICLSCGFSPCGVH